MRDDEEENGGTDAAGGCPYHAAERGATDGARVEHAGVVWAFTTGIMFVRVAGACRPAGDGGASGRSIPG